MFHTCQNDTERLGGTNARDHAICSLRGTQCDVVMKVRFQLVVLLLNGTKSFGLTLLEIRNFTRKDSESTLKLYFREISDFNFEISLDGFE